MPFSPFILVTYPCTCLLALGGIKSLQKGMLGAKIQASLAGCRKYNLDS